MSDFFQLIPAPPAEDGAKELLACNVKTQQHGLSLTQTQALELSQTRSDSLRRFGRVEFAGGILEKLIDKFYDSPYLNQQDYAETLNGLIETFYYFKNETLDKLTDDELLDAMRACFDGPARGSSEYMRGTTLETLANYTRNNLPKDNTDEQEMEAYFWPDLEE